MSSIIQRAQPAAAISAAVATAQIFPLSTNALVPAFLPVPGSGRLEQKFFEIQASGLATTAGAFTGLPSLYAALAIPSNPLVPGNWTLLGAGTATAFATTSGGWWLRAQLLFDSLSGKLQGSFSSNVNNTAVASAAFANQLTGLAGTTEPVFFLAVGWTFGTANAGNSAKLADFSLLQS